MLEWEGTGPVLEFAPNISGHEVEVSRAWPRPLPGIIHRVILPFREQHHCHQAASVPSNSIVNPRQQLKASTSDLSAPLALGPLASMGEGYCCDLAACGWLGARCRTAMPMEFWSCHGRTRYARQGATGLMPDRGLVPHPLCPHSLCPVLHHLPSSSQLELQGCRVRSNAGCGILQA